MNILELKSQFDSCLEELTVVFKDKGSDYFYTEKEIHSYFYHICHSTSFFEIDNTFLIHTEYPTPFKCRQTKEAPYIKKELDCVKCLRAHLDLVLINPNFVHWVEQSKKNKEIIYGLGGIRFSDYMPRFRGDYLEFCQEYNEAILLRAIEFKFFRHSYDGIKYSRRSILQDIEKLRLLREYRVSGAQISFAEKALSIVFIGNRFGRLYHAIKDDKELRFPICRLVYFGN